MAPLRVTPRVLAALPLIACGGSRPVPARDRAPLPADASVAVQEPDADDVPDDEVAPAEPDDDDMVERSCEEVVRDIAKYPPELADDAPERDWNLAIRAHILDEDCEHMWTFEDKHCLATEGPAACAAKLPNDIVERLTQLTELGAKIAQTRTKPAAITCKQVVAAHYAPIRWQGRLDGFSSKQKNQMIADSRALMQKACTAESWSASTRACLVLGGGQLCFFNTNIHRSWGYPANGSVRALGIPECDAYDAAITKLIACPKLAAHVRDALVRMHDELKANLAGMSATERAKRGAGCEAAQETVEHIVQSSGC